MKNLLNNKFVDPLVTSVKRDKDGDILAICGPWGPNDKTISVSKEEAIDQINKGAIYMIRENRTLLPLIVVNPDKNPYLRASPDKTKGNNLDNLPDCDSC